MAFCTRYGHYELIVVSFGLRNAPSIFMSLVNGVSHTYLDHFFLVFLDDKLSYSRSMEEHEGHLR